MSIKLHSYENIRTYESMSIPKYKRQAIDTLITSIYILSKSKPFAGFSAAALPIAIDY